jgi:hypothetical protein
MLRALAAAASVAVSLALLLPACAGKAPKQVEAPDALADKGADMATGGEDNGGMAKDTGGKSGEQQMHEKCCGECKAALAKDRTGQKPDAIPCADFTAGLDPLCLEHFRGRKTMASECN